MKYHKVFENLPVGVFLMGEVIEDCNEQTCRLFGVEREELLGRSLLDYSLPQQADGQDSRIVLTQHVEAALSGESQTFLWQILHRENSWIEIEILMSRIELEGRQLVQICTRDIRERKRVEESLHESEKRFRTLAEVSPVGIFYTDAEDNFLYVNERWCEVVGLTEEEALKKGLAWAPHPEDRERVLEEWRDAAERQASFKSEFRIPHSDGTDTWVYSQVVAEKNSSGGLLGYVGTITDISERKQFEEALEERNEFIEAIMVNLPIGLLVVGFDDLKVQYLNPVCEKIIGKHRDDFVDLNSLWEETIPDPHLRQQVRERICADLEYGDPERMSWEIPITKDSGEVVEILAFAIPMRDRNQTIITVQDVTDRKRAVAELCERNEFIETVTDNLPIGFVVLDYDDRKIRYANERIGALVGWAIEKEEDRYLDTFWRSAFPDKDYRAKMKEKVYADWKSGDPGRMNWETTITKASGELADLLFTSIPMLEHNLVIVTLQDVTELKRAEKLQMQLEIAAEVQSKLLPQQSASMDGFEISASFQPAYKIGGDFYDWYEVASGLVSITLGDIMGKGIAAAMLMATVRATMRVVSCEKSPALALRLADQALRQDLGNSESFVTLFHGQLNTELRTINYVDCGHGFVFMRRADGGVDELFPRGLPLGISADEPYVEGEMSFAKGDALVIFSDGLVDALPELSLDNKALADRLAGAQSAREMVEQLVAIVPQDMPLPDDLTVVVVRCAT